MNAEGQKDIFLSCFKCGRIVKSNDIECPRCGLQFGPGTLFECPFCCGLVWRNSSSCTTCGIDLTKFSEGVERSTAGFNMDEFVDTIIKTEIDEIKSTIRRVACPGCGLMIRGDETRCPRCDLPLEEAMVDCPVCGEKLPVSAKSCGNCQAVFVEAPEVVAACEVPEAPPSRKAKAKPAKKPAATKKKPAKKSKSKKSK